MLAQLEVATIKYRGGSYILHLIVVVVVCLELREKRSFSTGNKALQRVNAIPLKKRSGHPQTCSNGVGVFTHKGGRLLSEGSGVTVEIPENAIPRGRMQKIWFQVVQVVYDPSKDEDPQSLSDSGSFELESLLQEKREKRVQLSPVVVIGPADAVLTRPLVIRMPHCLPYRNNSWHLQMLGRASIGEGPEEEEERWSEIVNTIGLVQLPTKNNNKFHKKSAYQMHLDYVQIKTSRLGTFKLVRSIIASYIAVWICGATHFSRPHPVPA